MQWFFFSFDQLIAYLLIFFNWCDKVGLFFFFLPIIFFFFPIDSDWRFVISEFWQDFFSFSLSPWMLVDSKLVSIYIYIYIYMRTQLIFILKQVLIFFLKKVRSGSCNLHLCSYCTTYEISRYFVDNNIWIAAKNLKNQKTRIILEILSHQKYSSSSSSSCHAASTDIPDSLLPLLPIIHRLWLVFRATTRILR